MDSLPKFGAPLLLAVSLASCSSGGQVPPPAASAASTARLADRGPSPAVHREGGVTETVLHTFGGGSDGEYPASRLLYESSGKDQDGPAKAYNPTFYGTTIEGGTSNDGIVFGVTPSGTESILHIFSGDPDGATPESGLAKGLYGTTAEGGANQLGTVYQMKGSNDNVVYSFGSHANDGANPYGSLIEVNGVYYGTTNNGSGTAVCGTVFSITPAGNEQVVYQFKCAPSDGSAPMDGLVNVEGTLYGTTDSGGANGLGTVFSVTPSGTEVVLHSFAGGTDGEYPNGGLIYDGGKLYGTTAGAGSNWGTVFAITLGGNETVLHNFTSDPDGARPLGTLLKVKLSSAVAKSGATFYGTTAEGGANGYGTVFSITTSKEESVVYSFEGGGFSDGAYPAAGLIDVNGTLYGTTKDAGAIGGSSYGTVFSLSL